MVLLYTEMIIRTWFVITVAISVIGNLVQTYHPHCSHIVMKGSTPSLRAVILNILFYNIHYAVGSITSVYSNFSVSYYCGFNYKL